MSCGFEMCSSFAAETEVGGCVELNFSSVVTELNPCVKFRFVNIGPL
jgi:hypothetical protein